VDQLITFNEVVRRVPYSKVHIYRLVKRGKFPAPHKLGAKTVWFAKQIDDYIAALPAGVQKAAHA
jgi:predicted DNA-binding transcriptional regulator AlpA